MMDIGSIGLLVFALFSIVRADAPEADPAKARPEISVTGVVFNDLNTNGVYDAGEPGIQGVHVSNGMDIVTTDSAGRYNCGINVEQFRFVFVTTPAGYGNTTAFYHPITSAQTKYVCNFGLRTASERARSEFSFVHVSDVHYDATDVRVAIDDDLAETLSLNSDAAFIIASGDLVADGESRQLYHNYCLATKLLPIPVYNVIGNHDFPLKNYEEFLGPACYSFDYGQTHFVVLNSFTSGPQQMQWLQKDLDLQPKERGIVITGHTRPDLALLDWLSRYNVKLFCYGHWHSSKVIYHKKIMLVCTPSLQFGGLACVPKGYRIIRWTGKGIQTEMRSGGVRQALTIIHPSGAVTAQGGMIAIRGASYNSTSPVKSLAYRMDGGPWKPMVPGGGWLWHAQESVDQVSVGKHHLTIRAIAESNQEWEKDSEFIFDQGQQPSVTFGSNWTQFLHDNPHHGVAEDAVSPPLRLRWSQYAGSEIGTSSPVLADGRCYLGIQDNNNAINGGVTAVDMADGRLLWKFKADSSVHATPTVRDGTVVAVSVGGVIYALEAKTGRKLWRYDLDNFTEWGAYSPCVIDEGVVYGGVASHFVALDLKTGKLLWKSPPLGSSDWLSSFGAPAMDNQTIYAAFNSSNGIFALDKKNGAVIWNIKEGLGASHASPLSCHDTIYYAANNSLLALNNQTGKEQWRSALAAGWNLSSPVVRDADLIIGSADGKIRCFDARTGHSRWAYQTKPSIAAFLAGQNQGSQVLSSAAISGDMAYIGSSDGCLYAIDVKTGEKAWSYDLGVPILSSPAVSGNGVYVATYDP